jgi:hypothetical protein
VAEAAAATGIGTRAIPELRAELAHALCDGEYPVALGAPVQAVPADAPAAARPLSAEDGAMDDVNNKRRFAVGVAGGDSEPIAILNLDSKFWSKEKRDALRSRHGIGLLRTAGSKRHRGTTSSLVSFATFFSLSSWK